MTIEEAKMIKKLRGEGGYTWRAIAENIFISSGGSMGDRNGNQIIGRDLCTQAAIVLNENPDEEPWN